MLTSEFPRDYTGLVCVVFLKVVFLKMQQMFNQFCLTVTQFPRLRQNLVVSQLSGFQLVSRVISLYTVCVFTSAFKLDALQAKLLF